MNKNEALKKLATLEEDTAKLRKIIEESENQKITDKIKNINDIYNYLGVTEEDIIPYKYPKTKKHFRANAFAKIECIIEVYNEGTILDWSNSNQYKYLPYFKKATSGGGWVYDYCDSYYFVTFCSVGLYYKSSELAINAGNKFIDIYNDFLG